MNRLSFYDLYNKSEILTYTGCDVPEITVLQAPTPSISLETPSETTTISRKGTGSTKKSTPIKQQKLEVPKVSAPQIKVPEIITCKSESQCGEEEVVKRRGKRRKKRGRDSSRGPLAVQASIDPETQVATLDTNLNKNSALSNKSSEENVMKIDNLLKAVENSLEIVQSDSVLEPKILRHLQRELNPETLDMELDIRRKATLIEAYRSIVFKKKPPNSEISAVKEELNIPPINTELWLNLPRVFTRKSARFELPLHSRTLETLTPLQYLREHCYITNGRKLLYNLVFNRHKISDDENRVLNKDRLKIALGEMMGKRIPECHMNEYLNLVNLKDTDVIDFKTWCGMCALFERVFAIHFCASLLGKESDPCNEVEVTDFQSLHRRLKTVSANECLIKMLNAIEQN